MNISNQTCIVCSFCCRMLPTCWGFGVKNLKRFQNNQEEHVQPLSENKHGICKSAPSHNRELGFLRLLSLKMLGNQCTKHILPNAGEKIMVMNPMGIESAKQIRNEKTHPRKGLIFQLSSESKPFSFAGRLTFQLFNASWLALWLPSPNWSQRLAKHHILLITDTSLQMTQHGHTTSWWFQSIKKIFPPK